MLFYLRWIAETVINLVYSVSWITLALISINLILVVIEKRKRYKKLQNELSYSVPKISNFLLAHMDEFGERDNEVKWHKQFGKVFGFYNGDAEHLRVADLKMIDEIFIKQNKLFNSRTWTEYRLIALLKSILMNHGNSWKKTRRIIQPALAEYRIKKNDNHIHDLKCGLDKMINYFNTLAGVRQSDDEALSDSPGTVRDEDFGTYTRRGFTTIDCPSSPTGLGVEFNAYDVMQVITLDVIYRLAFDLDIVDVTKGADDPALKLVRIVMSQSEEPVYKLASAIPILRIILYPYMRYTLLKTYRKFVTDIVDHSSRAKSQSDVKSGPRRINHILWEEYEAGNLTRGEVRSNTMAILVAGFETTATTSCYVLWCIAKYTDLQKKLYADIQTDGIRSRYLDMFIKEVMRMFPALPNFVIRTPHQDAKVGGYMIKRGMSVYMSVNSVHYDESIWEEPNKFDPERFAEGKTYPPGAYAPFGLGHRMCAGIHLAQREMKTIVCEILTNFEIQLIAPMDMATRCSSIFLTRPKHDIRLRLIPIKRSAKLSQDITLSAENLSAISNHLESNGNSEPVSKQSETDQEGTAERRTSIGEKILSGEIKRTRRASGSANLPPGMKDALLEEEEDEESGEGERRHNMDTNGPSLDGRRGSTITKLPGLRYGDAGEVEPNGIGTRV